MPHAHWPCALQLSLRFGSHAKHAEPEVPQFVPERARHCGPLQQPFGQLVGVQLLQMPPSHVPPPGQLWHTRPAVPHAVEVPPVRHVFPFWQQPEQPLC